MEFRKCMSAKIVGAASNVAFCAAIFSFVLEKISAAPQEMTSFPLIGTSPSFDEGRDKFGWTPLMFAAKNGDIEAVKALVESGADILARDNSGFSTIDILKSMLRRIDANNPENLERHAESLRRSGLSEEKIRRRLKLTTDSAYGLPTDEKDIQRLKDILAFLEERAAITPEVPSSVTEQPVDFLPDLRLRPGVSINEVLSLCPDLNPIYTHEKGNAQKTNEFAMVKFNRKGYWDSALLHIKDSRIQAASYVFERNPICSSNELHNILAYLRGTCGAPKDRFIVYNINKQERIRSPAFAWETGLGYLVFSHLPTRSIAVGEPFRCRLTILADKHLVPVFFDVAMDSESGDSALFEMTEEALAVNIKRQGRCCEMTMLDGEP
ncbi:MAG: ankyrin repeat domain-containing protein [Kiritimatiellae bacterium]|nr:ankyrin repeat domain-containing protein [Kiritimatiellia bacterium]